LTACTGAPDKNTGEETVTPPAVTPPLSIEEQLAGIEYDLPDTWTVEKSDLLTDANFIIYDIVPYDENKGPQTTATLKITADTGDRDAKAVAEASKKVLLEPLENGRRIYEDPKLVSEGEWAQNGLTGYEYSFTGTLEGLAFTAYHLYVNKDDCVYAFEFMISDKTFADFSKEYKTFSESIK
jgi:hypothetical protein